MRGIQGHHFQASALFGAFNISDFVPFLKPFDLQGLQHQIKHIQMSSDQFLEKIIQDHMRKKKVGKLQGLS
jgi:hypothetical protein